jgi:hypothetical protein
LAKTKVFASFDFDLDRSLRHLFVGQAKDPRSSFEIADHSLKEASKQSLWEAKARSAIARSDKFVVLLGPRTRFASGVKKEVAMARELDISCFQLIGYPAGSADWRVPNGGRVYRWNWENLETLLRPPKRSFAQWFLGD